MGSAGKMTTSTSSETKPKALKPALAASLIVIDRSGNEPRFLMGRRSGAHVFMPNKYVFPGGKTDACDHGISTPHGLNDTSRTALKAAPRAAALALSAIRETYEETGLLIGLPSPFQAKSPDWQMFADLEHAPNLSALAYIARAITPPGLKRRYDTRFFACFRDHAVVTAHSGGDELEDLIWPTYGETKDLDLPNITRSILSDVFNRLTIDPTLQSSHEIPTYQQRYGTYVRSVT